MVNLHLILQKYNIKKYLKQNVFFYINYKKFSTHKLKI